MTRTEVLNKINSDIYLLSDAIGSLYNGKMYVIVNGSRIDRFSKTKRGAEGYIKRNSNFSYYDDYSQEMITPHANDDIVEIKAAELKDIKTDKKLWHDYLRNNLSNVFMYHMGKNIIHTAKNTGVTAEILQYIEEKVQEIEETHSMTLIEEYLDSPVIKIEEENKNTYEEEKINTNITAEDTELTETPGETETILNYITIKEDINTKTRENIFVVKLNNKVDYETYKLFETEIKSIGGYYSKFKKGFIFKSNPSEDLLSINYDMLKTPITASESQSTEKTIEYPEIDINDIETYTIDKELSKRENDISMFRSKDRDHNKEIQSILQSANDDIIELINLGCNKYIEYKAKQCLQSFKKKYYEIYKRILNHRVNNPSWAVTGRGGLNISRYNKKQSQLDNMMRESSQLIDEFNKKIEQFKWQIRKEKQQQFKQEIENAVNSLTETKEFKRVRLEINGDAVCDNVFDTTKASYKTTITAHRLGNYSIIKNWGCFRVYDGAGKEVYNTKTNENLEVAKKYVLYLLSKENQEAI